MFSAEYIRPESLSETITLQFSDSIGETQVGGEHVRHHLQLLESRTVYNQITGKPSLVRCPGSEPDETCCIDSVPLA